MDTVRYDSFWLPQSLGDYKDSFSKWGVEAIRFQNAQSTSSWTVPAVASVMSGLYPAEHRAGQFKEPIADLSKNVPSSLPENVSTLPEILSDRNFETRAFIASPFITFLFSKNQAFPGVEKIQPDHEVVENAKVWLDRYTASKTQKPFFLYLHFMAGHDEHWNSMEVVKGRNTTLSSVLQKEILNAAPGGICSDPNYEMCLRYQAYQRAIVTLRNDMNRLLTHLQDSGLLEQTVVILFSDHGEEFEDHLAAQRKEVENPQDVSGHGHGHSMYQELLHVPLLVWHPFYSGCDITIPVSLVDLAPTIADWLSLKSLGVRWSGKSLAEIPTLDKRHDLINRPIFSSGIAYGSDKTAVLWKQWKTIVISPDVSMMFNILSDPNENKEWNDPGPSFVLDQYVAQYNQAPSPWNRNHQALNEAQLEMIRSSGYLRMGGEP